MFKSIPGFKDADYLSEQCFEKVKASRYKTACFRMTNNTLYDYKAAIDIFRTISGWKDSDEQISVCQRRIKEIRAEEEEAERQAEEQRAAKEASEKRLKLLAIITLIIVLCIIVIIVSKSIKNITAHSILPFKIFWRS